MLYTQYKYQKNLACGADLTEINVFIPHVGLPAGGRKLLSFLHRFVVILQSKTLIFQRKIQVPKSPNFHLRCIGFMLTQAQMSCLVSRIEV